MAKRRIVTSPTLVESQYLEITGLKARVDQLEDALADLVFFAELARTELEFPVSGTIGDAISNALNVLGQEYFEAHTLLWE